MAKGTLEENQADCCLRYWEAAKGRKRVSDYTELLFLLSLRDTFTSCACRTGSLAEFPGQ